MAENPTGQRALLLALADADVRFVVIGGHAVAAHGYERATRDLDVVFATDREADGSEIKICSYDDLVAMKRLAGRPRDLEDLRELQAVRDQPDEQ